ncbi:hypothetical protein V8G54_024159 [Vigna mungo]|uniref:Uncharacterized protein n=1 Tax=Vigna mungo TaxID=3915 RepID=A0AAQ3N546_VIGMU
METTAEVVSSNCLLVSEYSESNPTQLSAMELGIRNFGCTHYRRRCKIRAPCCDEVFDCRHCHNEAKNSEEVDVVDRHDVPRHEIKKVQQYCINCGACMGKYFCDICKFFDDDFLQSCRLQRTNTTVKNVAFAELEARITFSTARNVVMEKGHRCVEGAMHHNCPVCFEYLFDTVREISVLPCAHTIHLDCVKEMEKHHRYSCPVCSKSICDMSSLWKKLDKVVALTPMPETLKNKTVWILCNDCGVKSHVQFHIVAHKCLSCNSYNTRQIQGAPATPGSSRVTEMVI